MAAKKGRVPPQLQKFVKSAGAAKQPKAMAAPKRGRGGADGIVSGGATKGSYTTQTKGAGIGASMRKGMPAADAGAAATPGAKGKRGGGRAAPAADAAGKQGKGAFGLTPGSSKAGPSNGRGKGETAGDAAGIHKNDRVLASPTHTFATSTIPRSDGSPSSPTLKQRNRSMNAPKAWDPDGDGDNDATAAGDTDHDYWNAQGQQIRPVPGKPLTNKGAQAPGRKMAAPSNSDVTNRQAGADDARTPTDAANGRKQGPASLAATMPTKTREMASPHIGFKAAAANAARSAGVSAQAGAAMVAAASQHASSKAKAKNPRLAKVARKGTTKQKGGTFK